MRTLVAAAVACLTIVGLSHADDSQASIRKPITIPAQGLGPALRALSKEQDIQVIFMLEDVARLSAPGLDGEMTIDEALNRLLQGTGLRYEYVDKETVTIVPTPTAPPTRPDEPTTQKEDASQRLEEILVTAQKTEEKLQTVPVPVTVITPDTLLAQNKVRLQDYYAAVPGLQFTTNSNGQPILAIRGLSTGSGISNSPMAIAIDDLAYGSSTGLGGSTATTPDLDPIDLARVEVLRGPQGTLYGASSIGGLVKFVTIDPSTDRVKGRAEVNAGAVSHSSEAAYGLRAAVNVPVNDTMALRFSGFARQDPGYIDNVVTGEKDLNTHKVDGARVAYLWRASADWTLKSSVLFERLRGDGPGTADPRYGDLEQRAAPGGDSLDKRLLASSLNLTGNIGAAQLTLLSAFNHYEHRNVYDETYTSQAGLSEAVFGINGAKIVDESNFKKVTQEARLTVPLAERFTWLAGLFYSHEKQTPRQLEYGADPATGAIVESANMLDGTWPTSVTEYAVFTDLTVRFTDRFDVQLGGRESRNRQSYYEIDGGGYTTVYELPEAPGPLISPRVVTHDDAFTYLLTPRFRLTDEWMTYARFASGYRMGGPNAFCVPFDLPCAFKPDETTNYEVGFKGDFWDRRLSIDASVYYIDWKDIQLTVTNGIGTFYTNAGRAKSRGVELALDVKPLNGLTVRASTAVGKAELAESFSSDVRAHGLEGDPLPFSSKVSGYLSVEQQFPLAAGIEGFVGSQVSYVGERKGNFARNSTRPRVVYPAYAEVGANAGVRHDTWSLALAARNLTDRRGIVGGEGLVNAFYIGYTYIQPRSINLSLSKSF